MSMVENSAASHCSHVVLAAMAGLSERPLGWQGCGAERRLAGGELVAEPGTLLWMGRGHC